MADVAAPSTDEREDRNARRIVTSLTLTKAGDSIVDAKAVLPYLLEAGGAPAFVTSLLVPVRESGSLLPQLALAPRVQRIERRRLAWAAGSVGQAVAIVVMAVLAATSEGAVLGWGLLGALAAFALARALSSIAFKDVLGRAVGAGRRGRVTGRATSAAGAVSLSLGVALRLFGEGAGTGVFVAMLLAAAVSWVVAAAVFTMIDEEVGNEGAGGSGTTNAWAMVRSDSAFRHFVVARTLLLASALSPPLVVAMAVKETGSDVAGLGPFVVASGLAALLGGRAWGHAADRSSRRVMAGAAGLAAILLAAFLLAVRVDALQGALATYVTIHFLLSVVHAGARVGRSTYVVDVAEGDRRTAWVAASNSAMGVLLLVVGAVVGALATIDEEVALLALVGVGLLGTVASTRLPHTAAEDAARAVRTGDG